MKIIAFAPPAAAAVPTTRVWIFSSSRGTVGTWVGLASAMSAARFFVSPPQNASVPPVSSATNETIRASTCASGRYWKITGSLSLSRSMYALAVNSRFACESTQPFGGPVVPDV